MSERRLGTPPNAQWVASMLRNYLQQDDALTEAGSVVVQMPDDPQTIVIFQRGGGHLMVEVNPAEVVV